MPLLCLLFDAHWWSQYQPPSDDGAATTGASGDVGRDGKPIKKTDTRKMSDAQFAGLFN